MPATKRLVADAIGKALKLRRYLNTPLTHAISAIDAAEQLGIEVRFIDLPSMEGMYVAGEQPRIVLSSLRPLGRRMFTCAHEIGHHVFGHGDQFDELFGGRKGNRQLEPNEVTANSFAAYFLMPKTLIDGGMKTRGHTYPTLNSLEVYALACWLGVGYRTLIGHLLFGLRAINRNKANELSKVEPKDIRQQVLGRNVPEHLHLVDMYWVGRAIDCEVGDYLMLPTDIEITGPHIVSVLGGNLDPRLVRASAPGIAQLTSGTWSAYLRVSPRRFVGRGCFRFEEEVSEQ